MESGSSKLEYEEPQTTPNGGTIWLSTSKVPLRGMNDEVIGILGVYYDITDRKIAEEKTRILATTDQLTGLANRHQFNIEALKAFKLAKREKKKLALLMLDLDKFKPVNDTYGHQAGDALLKVVANIFKKSTRETDVVARLGGDEFAILLVHPQEGENAETIAQNIIDKIKEPKSIMGHDVCIGVSIGIAIYPEDANGMELLIKRADQAMYKTKETGRGTFTFYNRTMEKT